MIEEIAGGENVAPGHLAAVSDDYTDDTLILQTESGLRKAALHFVHEIIDGDANGLGNVNFFVGFRAPITGDGSLQIASGYLRGRRGWGWSSCGAAADGVPNASLLLIDGGSFADAGMDNSIRGCELRGASPAAMLDAEDIERKRWRADRNDAVLANDAVLFAAADEFAGEEQQRTAAAIDQNELVNGSGGVG